MLLQAFLALLLQLSLVSAAPVSAEGHNTIGYGAGGGVVGFIVLVLDIIVFSTYFHPSYPNSVDQ